MEYKKLLIIGVSLVSIVLVIISLFSYGGTYFVSSEEIEKDYGSYDPINKEVTITNYFLSKDLVETTKKEEIVKIKLLTPLNNKVPRGYQKIAEYEINSLEALKVLITKMETYDKEDDMKKTSHSFDYKIKGTKTIIVNEYDAVCDVKDFSDNCTNNVIGNHTEERVVWLPLEKVDFLKDEKIIVGIFTEVQKGDKVEWIPTFTINDKTEVRVEEWAIWTESLNANIVAYYKLDESSGGVIDATGNITDGTNNGAVAGSTGKLGTSYDFEIGDGDYINLNNGDTVGEDLDLTGDFTFCTWIQIESFYTSLSKNNYIMGKRGSISSYQIVFRVTSTGYLQLLTSGGTVEDTKTAFTTGSYQFACVTRDDNGDTTFYKNGVELDSPTSKSLVHKDSDFYIGRTEYYAQDARGFDGLIDEVGIWERVLSSSEISDLYNGGDGITYTDVFNTAPTINAHSTSPASVYTNTNFLQYLTIWDGEADTLTGYVQFYKDNAKIGSVQSHTASNNSNTLIATLTSANFVKGDVLIAEYWAGDGTVYTSKTNSSSETVLNSVPTTPTTLTLTDPVYVASTLTAEGSGSSDADSDGLTYYYEFYNNDDATERQAYSTTATYDIQGVDAHDTMRVRTKSYDGTVYSGVKENTRSVSNTAPTTPTSLTLNETIHIAEDLYALGSGSSDADSDGLTYYYEFYNNDDATTVQAYSTTRIYTIKNSDSGDTLRVRTKAYDGTVYSSEKEATKYVTPINFSKSMTQSFITNNLINKLSSFTRISIDNFNLNNILDRVGSFMRTIIDNFNLNNLVNRLRGFDRTVNQILWMMGLEKTYTFSGVFNSFAFNNTITETPPGTFTAGETEFINYTPISTSNDDYVTTSSYTEYPYQKYNISLEESPNYVEFLWEGHTSVPGNISLYVWNYTKNNWSLCTYGSGISDFNLTAELYDLKNIRVNDGNVTFLVQATS